MRSTGLLAALLLAGRLAAQDTGEFENPIPGLFAGLNALTLSEELSAASLRIRNDGPSDDTRLDTFRAPWSTHFDFGGRPDGLRFDAVLGAMRARDVFRVDTPSGLATVRYRWSLLGLELRAGLEQPLPGGFRLRPMLAGGLTWLENEAEYNPAAEVELAPLIEGRFVNWDGWASSLATGLALEHPRDRARLDWSFEARGALTHVHVFEASSSFQEGSDASRLALLRTELGAPLGGPASVLTAWDLALAGIRLDGIDVDALGFDSFLELGGGLEFRLSRRFPRLRLGLAWLVGEDVRGYSFGLGFAP
jgi:hypothetical protein